MTREFVAACNADCRLADDSRRRLEQAELPPHDDKHLSSAARILVRMLRAAHPNVQQEVLSYWHDSGMHFHEPVFADRDAEGT